PQAWALVSKAYARLAAPSTFTGGGSVVEYRRQALAAATRAAQLEPSLYDAHTALALAYRDSEQIGSWRAEAQQAIDINSRAGEAYALLADSYNPTPSFGCARDRNPALAERYYRRAIEIDPRLVAATANFTYMLHWIDRAADGVRAAEEGLAILPGNPNILRARA